MTLPKPADNAWRTSRLLGRDALLRSLGTRLLTEQRILVGVDPALQCPSGVGRTRLVNELVRQVATRYSHVISLSGSSPAAWQSSLSQAARQLGLRQTCFRRTSDLTGALRGWFSSHDNWLLVADPLSDLDDLNEVTLGIHSGHIIAVLNGPVPSNSPGWSAVIPLGSLSTEDALQILRGAIDRDWRNTEEVVAATQIINRLERNPLAAELAGRAMWLSGVEPASYLKLLSQDARLDPLHANLALLVAFLEQQLPTALTLLAAGVALGSTPLPVSLFEEMARRLDSPRAPTQDPLRLLIDCGLLQAVNDAALQVTAVTDLQQQLPRESLLAGARIAWAALPPRVIRNRLHEHVCGELDVAQDSWAAQRISLGQVVAASTRLDFDGTLLVREAADAAFDLLLPSVAQRLLQRVLDHAVQAALNEKELLFPLVEIGTAYVAGEQFQLARKRWRQAVEFCPVEHPMLTELLLAISELDVNENRLERAATRLARVSEICQGLPQTPYHQLLIGQRKYLRAGVALGQGHFDKARDLFRTAQELRAPLLPADHPLLLRNRLMLARTEFLRKDYVASERILIDEVATRTESPKVSDAELGVACNFLGEQYYLNGRLSDAEPVYERTLALRRASLPRGHRLIGEMANRLAVIKSARGAYKESDALFRESLSNLEQTYGAEHPEVARVLNDLAESLFSQNKVEPARRLLERALNIQERSLRANDIRLGRTRCNLAAVYVARGRFVEAVRLYEFDVAQRRSQKTPDQISLATSLNNLAEALRSLGRYSEAEERLKESLAIRQKMVGPNHPQVAQILNNLGYLYLQQHRYDEARQSLEHALQIRETSLSANHPHLASTLGTLAEVCFTEGRYEVARPLYSRAIEIYMAVHGERHPHVASLQICSARNELRLGHIGRAELMLLRGKTTIEEVLGVDHRMSAKVLQGIAELAHQEKRYDHAYPMLERCLAIQIGTMSSQRLEIAGTLRLIADNLVARGLFSDALPRIVEAVDIQRGMLSPLHPEVIPNVLLIGQIQQKLGNPVEAEEALRVVIDHSELSTQSALVNVAKSLLPDVLIQAQKYDEAAELLGELIPVLDSHRASPELLNTLCQLAGIHYLNSDPEAALPVMERCVELSEQLFGPDSGETAKHLDNLAGVRFLLGQYATAEPAIQRAIEILERERPVRQPALSKARENYIQLLRQTDRIVEADQLALLVGEPPAEVENSLLSGSHVLDDL